MAEVRKVNYNGKLMPADSGIIPVVSRAFSYGDGLFESIRVLNGSPCFLDNHLNRLKQGLDAIKIKVGQDFSFEDFEKELIELIAHNGITEGGRVRITFSRSGEGFYSPVDDEGLDYLIQAEPLDQNLFALNDRGHVVDIYTDLRKQVNRLSCFKTISSQIFIMASLFAKEKSIDNALITNDKDVIIEAANSNIFIVSNGVLYTPPLEDGCLGGIMRMEVINAALRHDIKVYETSLRPQNLLVADELFLTNAIQGIQWVSSYRQKRYYNSLSQKLTRLLNEDILSPSE
jgi:branched-subunit amino acid aminotransferase/4-amino-4-deoxychorismate lyase